MSGTKLGHAHIFVRDVERSKEFYSEVLGLEITESEPGRWAFLSSGEAHHELALSQVGADAPGPSLPIERNLRLPSLLGKAEDRFAG